MKFENIEKKAWRGFRKIENSMMRLREIDDEKVLSMVNDGIMLLYALFVAESFLGATMFRIHWPEHFHQILVICTIMLLIMKLLLTCSYKWSEVVIMVIFTGVFLMARLVSGYAVLVDVLLFILASKDIPFSKIVKVYFVTVGFLLLVTIGASQCGMIENLVYHFEGRRVRQAFGGCYPTDFASFFVWLSFSWVYIRKEKLRFLEVAILCVVGIGVWYFCDARLSAVMLTLSSMLFSSVKLRKIHIKYEKEKGVSVIPNWIQGLAVLVVPLCATMIVFLSYVFSWERPFMEMLNSMSSGRLAMGRLAFERYKIEWFGQFIPMIGYGKSSLTQLRTEYFFLDSSFVSILMCYGFLVFLCIIFLFMYSSFKAKRRNDYYLVLIIGLIAVDCMVEHHMMEMGFNPFLFLLLAHMDARNIDGECAKVVGGVLE